MRRERVDVAVGTGGSLTGVASRPGAALDGDGPGGASGTVVVIVVVVLFGDED